MELLRRAARRPGGYPRPMAEKRPTNSELRLSRLEEDDARRGPDPGIFELFHEPEPAADEDAPLARDDDASSSPGTAE